MREFFKGQNPVPKAVILLVIVLIIANSFVLALAIRLIRLPGELSDRELAQQGAYYVYEYTEDLAINAGVEENLSVRENLAKFRFELEQANRPEEVAQVVLTHGRETQDLILREQESHRREAALSIIRQDPRLQEVVGESYISINRREGEGIEIEDPNNVLSVETHEAIQEHESLQRLTQIVEIRIIDGSAELVSSVTMLERLRQLEQEVESLRLQLRRTRTAAGIDPMTGSGVTVRMYDSDTRYGNENIVHDYDVRDVINELFAAGAAGIAVNNERLIATSSIRCAGPVILVNQKPIAVNPVIIEAVGAPEVLASSLDLIAAEYHMTGVKLEVEIEEKITLPAYGQS